MLKTQGIHHITAIVGDPQENVDFYAGILGLRLIKQTVNFDDPTTYHLYFGNGLGSPGTAMTFFPWPNAPQGVIGGGQVGVTQFVIPKGSFRFWQDRLTQYNVAWDLTERFNEQYLSFNDSHGLNLELVERSEGSLNTWSFNGIDQQQAIKGFGGATLNSRQAQDTAELLEQVLGLKNVGEDQGYFRFMSDGAVRHYIDVKEIEQRGILSVGTVHHIAWRASNDDEHTLWRDRVLSEGYRVTPFIDRDYFHSIYFREKGDVLFEIATDQPGFTVDEPLETLGEALKLPKQHEHLRTYLKEHLNSIIVRPIHSGDGS